MPDQPANLLVILTDEQRRDTLACYGNAFIQMPYLNRFARRACIFDDAHCTDPVCTPSRGSLLTGLYPHAHGAVDLNIPLHATVRCLPELLDEQAQKQYRTAYHGKWHLGDELYPQHGYEQFISIEDKYQKFTRAPHARDDRSDYHHFLVSQGFIPDRDHGFTRPFAARLPERYSKPRFLADHACQFIRQHRHRPWLLTVSMLEPHPPFFSCRNGQYDPDEVPLFPHVDHDPEADPASKPVPQAVRDRLRQYREHGYDGNHLTTEADWRQLTANYLGLCSLVDTHIGRILHTLHACGLDERTVVVFTSDHGEMMGSHRLLQKKLLYREATRVPLLIRLPGQAASVRLTGSVSQIDLVPTVLELLGQALPAKLHGRSLAPLLRQAVAAGDATASTRDDASDCVIVQHETSRTIVSKDGWRYSVYLHTGELELYDLTNDPGERWNRASDPAQRERMATLHNLLRQWQERTGDAASLPEPVIHDKPVAQD